MFQTNFVHKIKTHNLLSIFFSRKSCLCETGKK